MSVTGLDFCAVKFRNLTLPSLLHYHHVSVKSGSKNGKKYWTEKQKSWNSLGAKLK